uniref:Uncharacterized protein n=1 Tax=Onchocerca volvulus TaxID=6282 RepID=A0A8R1U0M2_ONCVO
MAESGRLDGPMGWFMVFRNWITWGTGDIGRRMGVFQVVEVNYFKRKTNEMTCGGFQIKGVALTMY